MPISPEANQMAQLQNQMQMDPQKLMMLLAALQQGNNPNLVGGVGAQAQPLNGGGNPNPPPALPGGSDALLKNLMGGGQPSPQTLGIGQPIPMQMPNPDPQGQQKQSPLPPDPMGMQ